jgi:hypothetical protein
MPSRVYDNSSDDAAWLVLGHEETVNLAARGMYGEIDQIDGGCPPTSWQDG